ncbi:hypothetical protein [Haloactinopolyspora sp.]|uniref:hypothetical protein n=1 Tax=Haloactinopolyspora sp. TaxID=1966353 RepID=UPI002609D24D|nr:hypothetical protein [Haloactinopolyspora sp.]
MADSSESFGPEFETQPDRVDVSPDYHTLPDRVEVPPDQHGLPDGVVITPPDDDIIDCFPQPSLEELEMALHRAQLVMEDMSALLEPALKAMEDGAWVSRRADEFSTGLTTHAGMAESAAQRCVDAIQEAIDTRGGEMPDPILRPL